MIKQNNFLYKNINENLVIFNLLLFLGVPMICSMINNKLGLDALALTGLMSIFNFFYYRKNSFHYRPGDKNKYIVGLLPYVAVAVISIFALGNPLLSEISTGENLYLALDTNNASLFVSASESARPAVLAQLRIIGMMSLGLCIYFMCDSIFLVRKVTAYSMIVAFLACVFGYLLHFGIANSHLIKMERVTDESFFSFINPRHWCLYATLAIALGTLSVAQAKQRFSPKNFLTSKRFFYILMQLTLYSSVCLMELSVYTLLASVVFLISMILNVGDALPSKKRRERESKKQKIPSYTKLLLPVSIYIAISLGLAAVIVFSLRDIFNTENILAVINLEGRERLAQDIAPLLESRFLFGWGANSFSDLFAFVQSSDMGSAMWAYPHSDFVFALLEYGVVGIALFVLTPILLLLRTLKRMRFNIDSIPLIITVVAILVLMFFSNPMQNPFLQGFFVICVFTLMVWQRAELRKFS